MKTVSQCYGIKVGSKRVISWTCQWWLGSPKNGIDSLSFLPMLCDADVCSQSEAGTFRENGKRDADKEMPLPLPPSLHVAAQCTAPDIVSLQPGTGKAESNGRRSRRSLTPTGNVYPGNGHHDIILPSSDTTPCMPRSKVQHVETVNSRL